MKKVKIDKLNIFGVQPSTVSEVPNYIDDLIDGNRVTALENNKQDNLSQTQLDAVNSGITSQLVNKLQNIEVLTVTEVHNAVISILYPIEQQGSNLIIKSVSETIQQNGSNLIIGGNN